MQDQFVQVLAAGGQNAHPAAHPAFHVLGPHREAANRDPQESRAGQIFESRRGLLAAFAVGHGRFGALFAPVMVHGQDAAVNGPQFDPGAFNFGVGQVHLGCSHSFACGLEVGGQVTEGHELAGVRIEQCG